MKALVSGATGFIGGALVSGLTRSGWEVRALARATSRHLVPDAEGVEIIEADLREKSDVLPHAADGCDVVFHAAAIRDRWGTSMAEYQAVNVEGTRRLLDAAAGRARRFVYVSSVGVFGHPGVLNIDESFPCDLHVGKVGYHRTKLEAEHLLLARQNEIEVVIARPTITYGPGDRDGMLTRLIEMIARGRFVRIGRGHNHMHLTYISDLFHGLLLTALHPDAPGQTLILSGPRSIAVRDLLHLIEQQLDCSLGRWFVPEPVARLIALGVETIIRNGTPPITRNKIDTLCVHRGFSSRRAQQLLGYEPGIDYATGLARTMEWMRTARYLPQSDNPSANQTTSAGVIHEHV